MSRNGPGQAAGAHIQGAETHDSEHLSEQLISRYEELHASETGLRQQGNEGAATHTHSSQTTTPHSGEAVHKQAPGWGKSFSAWLWPSALMRVLCMAVAARRRIVELEGERAKVVGALDTVQEFGCAPFWLFWCLCFSLTLAPPVSFRARTGTRATRTFCFPPPLVYLSTLGRPAGLSRPSLRATIRYVGSDSTTTELHGMAALHRKVCRRSPIYAYGCGGR